MRVPQDIANLLVVAIRDILWYKDSVIGLLKDCGVPTAILLEAGRMYKEKKATVPVVKHVLSRCAEQGDEGTAAAIGCIAGVLDVAMAVIGHVVICYIIMRVNNKDRMYTSVACNDLACLLITALLICSSILRVPDPMRIGTNGAFELNTLVVICLGACLLGYLGLMGYVCRSTIVMQRRIETN